VAAVRAEATKLLKMSQDDFLDLWDELSDDGRDKLREALAEELSKVAVDGGSQGLTQVLDFVSADTAADLEAMLAQVNEQAVAFAEERAAELVGMKWSEDAGAWIVNPNAEWAIDDTTRSRIQTLTTQAEQEGWSNDKLADALQDDTGFSDDRAEMIARTETAFADIQGNLAGWEASGVVEAKEWSVSQDEVCDDCLALDGKIVGLDEDFPEGDPPLHPRCRCDLLPVVMTQAGIDAATAGGGTDAAE
jgi:SPP1 gp7 family putative phage head morphogenesis protein